ncbi:MAG TPA: family 1 glycosylhydrolase [Pyrinomonadaceae bacterium]|jgi:beta-glucosidase/6-phospho-beta-glucosidase/beta-galactosidase
MMQIRIGTQILDTRPEDFIWASGVEDTFVPQTKPGHRALDEYQLMGHYEHWREDLALAREVGMQALRWGVPWYRVEPQPDEFDWRWMDEVLPYMVEELGITPLIDLMHYGCPMWMKRPFISKHYVERVANYAAAFARRYGGLIRWYTPLNEPLVNALHAGKRAQWPPYLRGDEGYIRMMLQIVKGITATVKAIKEIDPDSIMLHVEATGLSRAIRHDLEALAVEEQHRGYLSYDLLTGRVVPGHPLFSWLLRGGARFDDLQNIANDPIELDVIGMNFYPQWSTQHLYIDERGKLAFRQAEDDAGGFALLINDYYQRYRRPMMITETSAFGSDELRARWLENSVGAVKYLRAQGVPVLGYTWFPMFTMIDWRYRHETGPLEQYRLDLGLYRLRANHSNGNSTAAHEGRWARTPLVEMMQNYIRNPHDSIGQLAHDETFDTEMSDEEAYALEGHAAPRARLHVEHQPHEHPADGD